MSVPMRLLAVPVLAGVLYLSLILAGLSGFDPAVWVFYTFLFLVWHMLIHVQNTSMMIVIPVHGMVSAAFLGLGALIGQWVSFAPPLIFMLGLGVAATIFARIVRLTPAEAEELVAMAEQANQGNAAPGPDPDLEPEPEPELEPETYPELEPEPEGQPGSESDVEPEPDHEPDQEDDQEDDQENDLDEAGRGALDALNAALDALPPQAPGHHDLVAAIAPAIGQVPLRDLVSALFARARGSGVTRDLQALTVLLSDPQVARKSLGAGDADAAFHLIWSVGDPAALSHWATQSLALLDHVPEARADMPDTAALEEAAESMPFARERLQDLIRLRAEDGDRGAES